MRQELRALDRWDRRKHPLMQTIKNTLLQYPNAAFFLALQEVTPFLTAHSGLPFGQITPAKKLT